MYASSLKYSQFSNKANEESGFYVLCLGVLPVSHERAFQKTNNIHDSRFISEEEKALDEEGIEERFPRMRFERISCFATRLAKDHLSHTKDISLKSSE